MFVSSFSGHRKIKNGLQPGLGQKVYQRNWPQFSWYVGYDAELDVLHVRIEEKVHKVKVYAILSDPLSMCQNLCPDISACSTRFDKLETINNYDNDDQTDDKTDWSQNSAFANII